MEKFKHVVNEIFTSYFLMDELAEEDYSKKFNEIGLDLLDQVDLIMKIEFKFNHSIPDSVCENFETVNDIGKYLSSVGVV